MYNETDLAAAIRRLAIGAVECGKPSALCYGTVSVSYTHLDVYKRQALYGLHCRLKKEDDR